jgi:hypothetical protein
MMSDRFLSRTLLFLASASVATLAACSDEDGQTPADTGATIDDRGIIVPDLGVSADDAGNDAGEQENDAAGFEDAAVVPPDAGSAPACARNDAGRCQAVTWTSTASTFPVVVDHHTTFVARTATVSYLNVIGGIRTDSQGGAEEVYSAVRRAEILANGDLGPWVDAVPVPFPLAFHGQAVAENRIYLLAGVTADSQGAGASTAVLWGETDATGSVPEWQRGPRLPQEARLHATAVILEGRLYLIGGAGSDAALTTVSVSVLNPATGEPGPWSTAAPLPAPRTHHACVVVGPYIYVLAGMDIDSREAPEIWRSITDGEGVVSGWEVVGEIADAPWTASTFFHNNYVYVVGGGNGSGFLAQFLDHIRQAPLNSDFTLGEFEDVDAKLPIARSHVHQTPIHDGRIYSVGGRLLTGGLRSTNAVFTGDLW